MAQMVEDSVLPFHMVVNWIAYSHDLSRLSRRAQSKHYFLRCRQVGWLTVIYIVQNL